MSIVTNLLLIYFATMTPAVNGDGDPDLCDVVSRETSTPVICSPHTVGAPSYDADVCCAGDSCYPATGEVCPRGESRYYCELGEVDPTGEVDCYFEVPDYCESFACDPPPPGYSGLPQADFICCEWGVCTAIIHGYMVCQFDDIYWCSSLASNPDGTVDCVEQ